VNIQICNTYLLKELFILGKLVQNPHERLPVYANLLNPIHPSFVNVVIYKSPLEFIQVGFVSMHLLGNRIAQQEAKVIWQRLHECTTHN